MIKTVLVTGATSGIGEATARLYAKNGHRLIITGRRNDRLSLLKSELEERGCEVLSLNFDVRSNKEVEKHLKQMPSGWEIVDILVNNAGLAVGTTSIDDGELDDWERMIDTNIKGLLYVSKCVIPHLKKSKCPHIVNISSIAGRETYKNGNVYCATKHAVQSLSDAMRIDLLQFGIKVTSICPGAAETEFSVVRYHGDQQAADKVYENYDPLVADDIADTIVFATSRPNHVSISDLLITPSVQANTSHFLK